MMEWNVIHPYNAVHVVRVPGILEEARLRRAISATLEAHTLTGLTLNQERGTYAYNGAPADSEINALESSENLADSVSVEVARQLNTPFLQAGPFSPFRFFTGRFDDSFVLGLVYLHVVADAQSIVLLIKEIIENYSGTNAPGLRIARNPGLPPRNLLRSHPGAVARKLAALPSLFRDLRRSCRPCYRDQSNFENRVKLLALKPHSLECLVGAAKTWGLTVNDVLLALLMKSCALLAAGRERAKRRKQISVGCIVNTRRELVSESRGTFGLFLGSFVVTHAVPSQITLKELARDIGRITRETKRKKLYLAASLELSFGRFMLSCFSKERRMRLYQKHYPLWGGLTNMNINSLWQPDGNRGPLDYLRAVSTGPATPLVLSFTTVGTAANIGLSYRTTVFSTADVERLVNCLLGSLADLELCK